MPSSIMTKKLFAQALKDLMRTEPFTRISVTDLTTACGMNRNSFYYHFKDKYDLVNWIFMAEIMEEFTTESALEFSSWELIERVSDYFYRHCDFYKNVLSYEGQNSFYDYFRELLYNLFDARSEGLFKDDIDPELREFALGYFLDGTAGILINWLKDGTPIPPKRFTELLRKSATGLALKILEQDETETGQYSGGSHAETP